MSNKRKRNDFTDPNEVRDLLTQILEDLTENQIKKQKIREVEERELIKEMKGRTNDFNVEADIKHIIKDIVDPIIEIEKVGDTAIGTEPIYNYVMNIPFPNSISYNQLNELQALHYVISLEVVKSKKPGNISINCKVSKDSSLKIAFARRDLLKSKPTIINQNRKEKANTDGSELGEIVGELLESHLSIDMDTKTGLSNRKLANGMEISILTKGVSPPISMDQIRRVKTHGEAVIFNCFFKAAGSKSDKILLVLEMFDNE